MWTSSLEKFLGKPGPSTAPPAHALPSSSSSSALSFSSVPSSAAPFSQRPFSVHGVQPVTATNLSWIVPRVTEACWLPFQRATKDLFPAFVTSFKALTEVFTDTKKAMFLLAIVSNSQKKIREIQEKATRIWTPEEINSYFVASVFVAISFQLKTNTAEAVKTLENAHLFGSQEFLKDEGNRMFAETSLFHMYLLLELVHGQGQSLNVVRKRQRKKNLVVVDQRAVNGIYIHTLSALVNSFSAHQSTFKEGNKENLVQETAKDSKDPFKKEPEKSKNPASTVPVPEKAKESKPKGSDYLFNKYLS